MSQTAGIQHRKKEGELTLFDACRLGMSAGELVGMLLDILFQLFRNLLVPILLTRVGLLVDGA